MMRMIKATVPALLLLLLTACAGQAGTSISETTSPTSMSPPTTVSTSAVPATATPVDTPDVSTEEMTAALWNKIPDTLPGDYRKADLEASTGAAGYVGDGKWTYSVEGTVLKTRNLPPKTYEKTPGQWVRNFSRSVTSYHLTLTANFYEKTGTFEVTGVAKSGEETREETIDEQAIEGKKLKVEWITGTSTGYWLEIQGRVENTGVVALEGVLFEITTYDNAGVLIRTDTVPLTPGLLEVGRSGSFYLKIEQELTSEKTGEGEERVFGSYNYRFVLPSGEVIVYDRPD